MRTPVRWELTRPTMNTKRQVILGLFSLCLLMGMAWIAWTVFDRSFSKSMEGLRTVFPEGPIRAFRSTLARAKSMKDAGTSGADDSRERSQAGVGFKIGDLDAQGRLIFWTIDAFDHIEPFVLREDDYGVVLYNDGSEEKPVARYVVAFQGTREIVSTGDFGEFQKALAKIPKGASAGRYNTCSVPREYGLDEDTISKFEDALGDAGVTVKDEGRGVCYCPNSN